MTEIAEQVESMIIGNLLDEMRGYSVWYAGKGRLRYNVKQQTAYMCILDNVIQSNISKILNVLYHPCIPGIGAIVLVVAYIQVACWQNASYNQSMKIRINLFQSILRQDIGWFDTHESGELNTRLSE